MKKILQYKARFAKLALVYSCTTFKQKSFVFTLLCLSLYTTLCFVTACAPHQAPQHETHHYTTFSQRSDTDATSLLRADPGYIQWLVQQSLLYNAKEYIQLVSGTNLTWQNNGYERNHMSLLEKSSMWIDIHARKIMNTEAKSSALAMLSSPTIIAALQKKGISLYLSDIVESDSLWSYNTVDQKRSATLPTNAPSTPISYALAHTVGAEQELMALQTRLRQVAPHEPSTRHSLQLLGTDIIPASTGLGPDFFLAARGHKEYIGAYAMIEIAPSDWHLLPQIQEDWQCEALTVAQEKLLVQKGVIPLALERDRLGQKDTQPSTASPQQHSQNWAATGTIRGVDGNLRRWIYAYAQSPSQAILHWNDPSGLAKRIFSASIIKNTGTLAIPLVGLSLQDLYGFTPSLREVATSSTVTNAIKTECTKDISPEPMFTVATALAHEIRAYGGWSWLRQALPNPVVHKLMDVNSGPDFFTSKVGELAWHAVQTGQASPLHTYFDTLLGYDLDCTRLVHMMPNTARKALQDTDIVDNMSAQDDMLIRNFVATQSGLIMVPDESLMGMGAASHACNQNLTHGNISATSLQKSILAMPDTSWRQQHRIATAKLIARLPSSDNTLMLLSEIPQDNEHGMPTATSSSRTASVVKKSYFLTITNFSKHDIQETIEANTLFPQHISEIIELSFDKYSIPTMQSMLREGDRDNILFEIPAKKCRIFIITM
ncbi:MAG: hypothetical protein R3Y11_01925 [Pseudomonadota bacterium]